MSPDSERFTHGSAGVAARDTASLLRDRVLIMATDPGSSLVDEIDPSTGGLVLSGQHPRDALHGMRLAHPDFLLLAEPTSAMEYVATAETPFQIPDAEGLFGVSLESLLQGQRDAGANVVVTPSGQVRAEDSDALKAVVAGANRISDMDILTLVVVQDAWLTPTWVESLCAVLRTSKHPVALGVANGSADPLQRKGAVAGYSKVVQEVPSVIAWRTDLSGIGALSHGATAAVVGRVPSQRRYSPAGTQPHASDKTDRTPHVLLPALMRYSRTSQMRVEWFAQGETLTCLCHHCQGRSVDRFDVSAESKETAYLHNAAVLREIVAACLAVPAQERPAWWTQRLRDAQEAHAALGARIGREIEPPPYISRWLGEAD